MKKTLKILLIFIFTFILFSIGKEVEANSIQKISMDIFVDDKGDAYVTEIWDCKVTQGTEVYHPYYNFGNSEIKNLTVSEGSIQYTTLSKWNTSGTIESKANKCGINKISNGVELCWGISKYGTHTYTVKYTITDFVSETTDSQMIYWTVIPYDFSTSIGSVYIKIHTNFYIQDTIDVWGYGNYGGTAYVHDGCIEMQSDGRLATDEYMTILVKFPLRTFETTNKLGNDFEHYYDMAEDGAIVYIKPKSNNFDLDDIIAFIVIVGIIIMDIFFSNMSPVKKFDYGTEGKRIPKNVPYFREIPCQKDIFRAYYIGYKYSIIKKKTDILGAIILKWLKDGAIRIEEKETGVIFKKENIIIVLKETDSEMFNETKEKELFKMLYAASKDGYLECKEFEKWCKYSYSKVLSWFDTIISEEKNKLIEDGLIKVKEKVKLKIFKRKIYQATPKLKQEALKLAGLKRYLNEYTLINEREAIEVELFEEYLIYAQIIGIAKKVAKQFENIYPEIIECSNFISYDYIAFVHMSSHRGISAAESAREIAIARASNYSSGGGGFSSRGGGRGSFGGGRGGRRFSLKFIIDSL